MSGQLCSRQQGVIQMFSIRIKLDFCFLIQGDSDGLPWKPTTASLATERDVQTAGASWAPTGEVEPEEEPTDPDVPAAASAVSALTGGGTSWLLHLCWGAPGSLFRPWWCTCGGGSWVNLLKEIFDGFQVFFTIKTLLNEVTLWLFFLWDFFYFQWRNSITIKKQLIRSLRC